MTIVNKEKKKNTVNWYLSFNNVKIRYKPLSDLCYFNHPFVPGGNSIQLIDDVFMDKSISELRLGTSNFDEGEQVEETTRGKKSAVKRKVVNDSGDEPDSIFDFTAAINSTK